MAEIDPPPTLQVDERLRLAFSNSNVVGTWDWDILNDRVYTDERFARIYSVDPQQAAAGVAVAQFMASIHPEDRGRVEKEIADAVASGRIFSSEHRLVQADGSVRHIMATGQCERDANGVAVRLPGAAVDISDQRLAEGGLVSVTLPPPMPSI